MTDSNQIIPKAWLTKYALTVGIIYRENARSDGKYLWDGPPGKITSQIYGDGEWFESREDAVARVLEMIRRKRKTIEKTVAKLDELQRQLSVESA